MALFCEKKKKKKGRASEVSHIHQTVELATPITQQGTSTFNC